MATQGTWGIGPKRQTRYTYKQGSDDQRYISLRNMMAQIARKDLGKKRKATSADLSPKARTEIAALQKEYDGLKDKGLSFKSVMGNKREAREKWEARGERPESTPYEPRKPGAAGSALKSNPDYERRHSKWAAERKALGVGDRWVSKPWATEDPRIGGVLPSKLWKPNATGGRKYMGYAKTLNAAQQQRADDIAAHPRNADPDNPIEPFYNMNNRYSMKHTIPGGADAAIKRWNEGLLADAASKKKESNMTKGEAASMANAYEPSLFTTQNSFNTQATRDIASGRKGLVGNAKAGNSVYNPKSSTRKRVSSAIRSRGQKLTQGRKERSLDRATERMF